MSTGLRFGSTLIPGTVMRYAIPAREVQVKRTHFWGVLGESQISGAPGGRTLAIPVLVFDAGSRFSTREKLVKFLIQTVGSLIGTTESLHVLLNEPHTKEVYPECCLDNFTIRPEPGVILDVAGTLGGKYFCEVDFTFRQL